MKISKKSVPINKKLRYGDMQKIWKIIQKKHPNVKYQAIAHFFYGNTKTDNYDIMETTIKFLEDRKAKEDAKE